MAVKELLEKTALRCEALIPPGASVLVAVSGGADSVALLNLLHRLSKTLAIKRLGVLHVNHGLRGSESDRDEKFVRELAKKLALSFYSKRLGGKSLHDAGIEAWARSVRYRFFHEIQKREKYDLVATGHTANDQAETVLMRLLRGTGLRGLRGILPGRDDGVIRPVIDLRRNEIETWLLSQKISCCHDSSNDDQTLNRNRVRHTLLPDLQITEPDIVSKLGAIAAAAQDVFSMMQPGIDKWTKIFVKKKKECFVVDINGFDDDVHASEALRSLLEEFDIPADAGHIDEILTNHDRAGRTFLLPGNWQYRPVQGNLVFGRHRRAVRRRKKTHQSPPAAL